MVLLSTGGGRTEPSAIDLTPSATSQYAHKHTLKHIFQNTLKPVFNNNKTNSVINGYHDPMNVSI